MFENIEKIRKVKDLAQKAIFKKQNVVGVGIGRKIKDGVITDELCLKIYVEEKKHLSQITTRNLIEKEIDGIKTDVVGVGKIRFLACDQKTRKRPAYGGDSIGSCHSLAFGYIMAGTLGCVVVDKSDGKRCILSNNHVIADKDSDTDSRANVGDAIVQPGTLDTGTCAGNADRIATLKRWIPFMSAGNNLVDAGIGEIINGSDVNNAIGCDIGSVNGIRELVAADVNILEVQKCGRTTCHTTGTVTDIDVTVDVGYELLTPTGIVPRTYRFIHQIFTTDMSTSGDSGSLILTMDKKAVGLLFAGSSTVTVASPIQTVFDELNVEFPISVIHCYSGGPIGPPVCLAGGPDDWRRCFPSGPMILECRPGGPDKVIHCRIGGPDTPFEYCSAGPMIRPICLACGPDSPMNCGSGGPDMLIDVLHCAAGPALDFKFKIPIDDPGKLLVLNMDKIPRGMKRAFTQMLKEMAKER